MNQLMHAEIHDQPKAVERSLGSLRQQAQRLGLSGRFGEVVFTGSGDSYFAPLALQYAARQHIPETPHVLPAMETAHYFPASGKTLVVAISVSGWAKRTVEAARAARDAGAFVLTITANPESALAQTATARLVLEVRSRSRKTPHTTDFLTTLLAIAVLLEHLGDKQLAILDRLPQAVGEAVVGLEEPCTMLGQELAKRDRFRLLGAGPSFAVAQYGAEKFWEAGGLEAHAYELEEFAHGAHLLVEPGDPAFLLVPEGGSTARAAEIGEGLVDLGARVVTLTDAPQTLPTLASLPLTRLPEEWSPFVTAVPLQWLCWAIATAKGYDVVTKDGRHADPSRYELVHERWVRG